ncbi:hypothetical protein ACE6H2_006590 [Prunus campanulata]
MSLMYEFVSMSSFFWCKIHSSKLTVHRDQGQKLGFSTVFHQFRPISVTFGVHPGPEFCQAEKMQRLSFAGQRRYKG